MWIFSLPVEVTVDIFEHINDDILLRSRSVCHRWKSLVDDERLWMKKFVKLRHRPQWNDCCSHSWKQRYFIAKKWARGRVVPRPLVDLRKKYIPWLQLCPLRPDNTLWLSWGSRIDRIQLPVTKGALPMKLSEFSCGGIVGKLENDDFCRHIVRSVVSAGDQRCWMAAGTRSGILYYHQYSTDTRYDDRRTGRFQAHSSDLHCVDLLLHDSLAITGSRDRTVKIWRVPALQGDFDSKPTIGNVIRLGDRAWCLKVNQKRPCVLAVGSAACWNDCPPITLWDLESGRRTGQCGAPCRRGAGVLDLSFISDSVILSGGYDSVVRLWDLRMPGCASVWSWEETYNSNVYCLADDGANSVFVGTARYGLVWLLDTRFRSAVQNYYIGTSNRPVYSLAASTRALYVGLDNELCSVQCRG